jgi:hypothetical protein
MTGAAALLIEALTEEDLLRDDQDALEIGDCNRRITLSFDSGEAERLAHSLYKLELLEHYLASLRTELLERQRLYDAHEAPREGAITQGQRREKAERARLEDLGDR